jgi:hypothetical protein
MTDIVICSIPRMSIYYPPAAPALIKASVQAAGYTATAIDFVIQFHDKYFGTPQWDQLDQWLVLETNDPESYATMKHEADNWADQMLSLSPKWIGISVFSFESHKIAKLLCMSIRKKSTSVKIVLGGAGLSGDVYDVSAQYRENNLCDEIITGDGEASIIKLLQETYTGKFDRLANLDNWPHADFSDYNLDLYKSNKQRKNKISTNKMDVWQGYGNAWYRSDEILTLPLVGSRGCVRKCSFCDIPFLWPKYKTRSAENIAQEVIEQYAQHDVQRFHFTDSLINGNQKNFRKLAEILAAYRTKNSADFTITGQYICRSEEFESQEYYNLLSSAGFKILEIGIESGSEAVRWHMGKKFYNRDVDVLVERLHNANMKAVLLFIVGYPTETADDFRQTMDMLTKYQPYVENGTVVEACLGGTQHIDPNSALGKDPHIITSIDSKGNTDYFNWTYTKNPELTFKERIRRRLVIMEHAQSLGYLSPTNNQEIAILRKRWKSINENDNTVKNNDSLKPRAELAHQSQQTISL